MWENERRRGRFELERGLLARVPRSFFNQSEILPSLGTDRPSAFKEGYVSTLERLHNQTVRPGGQWARAKTFGSQLWPDVQREPWDVDHETPETNDLAMNYWNPSGAELLEFFRTGDPKWVWDFALPQSWLQMFTAYLNIGDHQIGNRGGLAVNSGGIGEGHWHRERRLADGTSVNGSDDYNYNMGQHLAYAIRPNLPMRDRFCQAGRTLVDRYGIPRSREMEREEFVSQIDITRQSIQHFEMLANAAEFVPTDELGAASFDGRLREIVRELAEDNLSAGVMCQINEREPAVGDWCFLPQQFMQNSQIYYFFLRYALNYDDNEGVRRMLVEAPRVLNEYGLPHAADGSLVVEGDWASRLRVRLSADRTQVVGVELAPDSDNQLAMYGENKPQTMSLLWISDTLSGERDLSRLAADAADTMDFDASWGSVMMNESGWWKAAAQVMQGTVFGVGLYDEFRSVVGD